MYSFHFLCRYEKNIFLNSCCKISFLSKYKRFFKSFFLSGKICWEDFFFKSYIKRSVTKSEVGCSTFPFLKNKARIDDPFQLRIAISNILLLVSFISYGVASSMSSFMVNMLKN